MYYSFDAYFSGKRVIIKGKEYKLCEILMCYLTAKTKDLQDTYYKCCRYVDILHYPENDIEQIQSRKFFQTAIDFYLSIEKLMRKTGNTIASGDIAISPLDGRESPACKYCDYSKICGIENRETKRVPDYNNSEVFEKMKEGE